MPMDINDLATRFDEYHASVQAGAAEVARVAEQVNKLEAKFNRPGMTAGAGDRGNLAAERKALGMFVKTDNDTELKAMSVDGDPSGGYVVMPQVAESIRNVERNQSPIRRLAGYQPMTTGDAWVQPVEQDEDWGAEDVGEKESRPETDNPDLGVDTYPLNEIYANVKITQKLLDLSFIDIGAWIDGRIADKFARKEAYNYVLGNGIKAAMGILSYPRVAEADFTRPRGKFEYVPSGAATSVPADSLRDLYWRVRAPFRINSTWLMASNSANAIDKLKTSTGEYIWRDSSAAGVPPTLLGRPVEFDENMPAIGADSAPICFGDFKRGYLIVERAGLRMLRDPYTDKPNVLFYTIKRSGGGAQDFHALKFLKVGTS